MSHYIHGQECITITFPCKYEFSREKIRKHEKKLENEIQCVFIQTTGKNNEISKLRLHVLRQMWQVLGWKQAIEITIKTISRDIYTIDKSGAQKGRSEVEPWRAGVHRKTHPVQTATNNLKSKVKSLWKTRLARK